MVRTQIYLTQEEHKALKDMAAQTGRKQSELIREAVDRFVAEGAADRRHEALEAACGIWKERTDLPDFQALRREMDRPVADWKEG